MNTETSDLAQTLVLNALRDVVGGTETVLTDDQSHAVVREAYQATTDKTDRQTFEESLDTVEDNPDRNGVRAITSIVNDVVTELVKEGVETTFTHKAPLSLPSKEVHLYCFMRDHDPRHVADLSLPSSVKMPLVNGATDLAAGNYTAAATAFERALSRKTGNEGGVTARVLAAYIHHLLAEDDAALDYIEEALHLEPQSLSAKAVGIAASHRYPEKFRHGKLAAGLFFRWRLDIPDGGDADVIIQSADGGDSFQLPGRDSCRFIEYIQSDSQIVLTLQGTLSSLPTLFTYYVAFGVVDVEVYEARSVEQVLLSGPNQPDVTETIQFKSRPTE